MSFKHWITNQLIALPPLVDNYYEALKNKPQTWESINYRMMPSIMKFRNFIFLSKLKFSNRRIKTFISTCTVHIGFLILGIIVL